MDLTNFFEAYGSGQRRFLNLDFEYLDGFSNKNFKDIIFENCFLYLDFRNSDLTNAQFINCNIKEIDLRYTNLTNAIMKNCLVESAMFKGAIVNNFKFIDNHYFGLTIGQKEFSESLINADAHILTMELIQKEYLETMTPKMIDVTEKAEPVIDIWEFVSHLEYEKIVLHYVNKNQLVEKVYRNQTDSYDHILLPTENKNVFVVIIVGLNEMKIKGYFRLDLEDEYGIS